MIRRILGIKIWKQSQRLKTSSQFVTQARKTVIPSSVNIVFRWGLVLYIDFQ